MPTKTKTFDCVKMKRDCQLKLQQEYETRKGEFDNYYDFIESKAGESELAKIVRDKIARGQ